jgi:hypothetical protein
MPHHSNSLFSTVALRHAERKEAEAIKRVVILIVIPTAILPPSFLHRSVKRSHKPIQLVLGTRDPLFGSGIARIQLSLRSLQLLPHLVYLLELDQSCRALPIRRRVVARKRLQLPPALCVPPLDTHRFKPHALRFKHIKIIVVKNIRPLSQRGASGSRRTSRRA